MTHPDQANTRPIDPVTDEAGSSHPVGTGVGIAGGAAMGATMGMAAGPAGAAVGAVVGAVVGGLAGNTVAEAINPHDEDAYWRAQHAQEPYFTEGYTYDDYAPAYRAGYESRMQGHADWNHAQQEWERRWDAEHAPSRLEWSQAEPAIKAAWERANRAYVQEGGS